MKTLLTILLTVAVLTGCRKSDFDKPGVPGDVKLSVLFGKHEDGAIKQFSLAEGGANSDAISDLNLFVFDPSGALLNQGYYTTIGAGVSINTTSGQRNICAVANYGSQITGITKLSDLTALYASAATPSEMINSAKNFIMTKQTGQITIPAPSTPGGPVSLDPILLDRLTAKVTLTMDKSDLNAGVVITPVKVALRQVANTCNLFTSNIPTATSQVIFKGDSTVSATEIISTDHTTAIPLYLYENMQGVNGTTTDQTQKTPAAGKAGICSYLEITANYVSPDKEGAVVYRYWLGMNTLTNFSIIRNTWYQISLAFHGSGAITENTWRVNVAGLNDVFMPTALNFPMFGGRVQVYNLNTLSTSTTLGNLLQNGASATLKDSLAFVMTKSDNTGATGLVMGNIAGSTTYNLTQRYKGNNELFVDVSQLAFPKNSTFGNTTYPVTKYIQIYSKGSDIGTWRVRSSANWLYIGNGASYPSFTATATPGTTGTTGMLNKNGGALQSTVTMSSIAVRCSDNTTATTRMASVVFYSQTGSELARVFVTQNPSTYPKSPTGLTYIPGGVFKPGAFAANGTAATPAPANTSTAAIYMKILPFYLTTREFSVQEFCDYLNDLGVTAAAPTVGGLLGTLLGGGGGIGDYPGGSGLLNILLGNVSVFGGTNGPVLSGGKWIPASNTVTVNSTAAATVSVPTPNYPMNNITFYGAYDCGYWMNKLSDRGTVTRASTYGLPTEMEWEAAARGIQNGFTIQANFDGSGDVQKNGLFPYPFPSGGLNTSLTGGETGEVIGLKSIAWYSGGSWNQTTGASTFGSTYPHPAGNLVPNSLGLYDMAGNVAEWNVDIYNYGVNLSFSILGLLTGSVYLTNLNLLAASDRIVRGGANTGTATTVSVGSRTHVAPDAVNPAVGFRPVIH